MNAMREGARDSIAHEGPAAAPRGSSITAGATEAWKALAAIFIAGVRFVVGELPADGRERLSALQAGIRRTRDKLLRGQSKEIAAVGFIEADKITLSAPAAFRGAQNRGLIMKKRAPAALESRAGIAIARFAGMTHGITPHGSARRQSFTWPTRLLGSKKYPAASPLLRGTVSDNDTCSMEQICQLLVMFQAGWVPNLLEVPAILPRSFRGKAFRPAAATGFFVGESGFGAKRKDVTLPVNFRERSFALLRLDGWVCP